MNAFAVRATAPGLRVGPEALTMGMRAIVQNEIFLDDVFVSREDLLGAEGEGFAVGEDSFGFARLGISAIALGGLRRAIQVAHRYAGRRKIATGLSLDNAKTREILSALVCAAACLESLVEMTGTLCNQSGAAPAHLSAICKIVGPELLWTGVDRVVQLMGGRGYIEPNLLPQMLRDARLLRIFEGPTETLEMHLGAAILGEFVTYDSLYGSLNAPKATALVREIVSAIAGELDRTTGHGRMMATQRAKLSVGHLAAWGAIAAAAEHRHAANPHDKMNEVAFRWAFADLERRITDLKRGTPGLMDASALNSVVSGYVDHIGDIEQTLPGADYLIDPLLRRDH